MRSAVGTVSDCSSGGCCGSVGGRQPHHVHRVQRVLRRMVEPVAEQGTLICKDNQMRVNFPESIQKTHTWTSSSSSFVVIHN